MNKVLRVLEDRDDLLITAHVNPEGDSIGSQLAFYYLAGKMGKKAVVVDQDDVPENLRFLPGSEKVMKEAPEGFRPSTAIVLDCPVKERVGSVASDVDKAETVVNIDHHVSNEYFGDVNWVEPEASSVGEMLYYLAEASGAGIDEDMATLIYTAIVTDTGMFNYANTKEPTHVVAGKLLEYGVKPNALHRQIFENRSLQDVRLLGKVLTTVEVEAGGTLAHMSLTRSMLKEEGMDSATTDEFINYPRSIKGVEVTVFFKESGEQPGIVNVSFRSQGKVNVNEVASIFGGGGHKQAAGCKLEGDLDKIKQEVLSGAREALKDAN